MSDKVSTIALRGIACDIEDCEQPQSWADAMRAAVSEIEKLRAALREIKNKARTGRPPFMSTKTDYFQIASAALGEKE
jgi:hypothetical protein